MIRKLTLPFITLIFIIMTTNISYADWPDVDDDCYSLGGIVLAESTLDDVMAIYGKPDYYGQMGFNKRWIQYGGNSNYNTTLQVKFFTSGPNYGTACWVLVDSSHPSYNRKLVDNGVHTNRGVYIGMPFEDALRLYWECIPEYMQHNWDNTTHFFMINTATESILQVHGRLEKDGKYYVDWFCIEFDSSVKRASDR